MKAIVVSPHPDDETLGAGGTVLKLISQGTEVVWLNVTNMKSEYGYPAQVVRKRADEIEQVMNATGYSAFYDLGLRPAALEQYAKTDIISETNYASVPFHANCYVDISPFVEKKIKIMEFYQSELLKPPFPRSKEGLLAQARYRGSACYCEFAEAFQVVKEIII